MKFEDLKTGWGELSAKAKLMAAGTIALIGASVFLSLGIFPELEGLGEGHGKAVSSVTVEEGVEIPADADPIPIASNETRLVTSLMDVLTNKECLWVSKEDELCWMEFTEDGFSEYNGDLRKSATIEFYSIEVTENGREGTWRITYGDGSIHDASFTFIQDRASGYYSLASEAFPTHETYLSKAITSEDVLEW